MESPSRSRAAANSTRSQRSTSSTTRSSPRPRRRRSRRHRRPISFASLAPWSLFTPTSSLCVQRLTLSQVEQYIANMVDNDPDLMIVPEYLFPFHFSSCRPRSVLLFCSPSHLLSPLVNLHLFPLTRIPFFSSFTHVSLAQADADAVGDARARAAP